MQLIGSICETNCRTRGLKRDKSNRVNYRRRFFMKSSTWPRSGSRRNRERLVAIMAAILLAGSFGSSRLLRYNSRPQPGAEALVLPSSATDSSRGDFYYFRSGQWLADLRTLVAACGYVLELESADTAE